MRDVTNVTLYFIIHSGIRRRPAHLPLRGEPLKPPAASGVEISVHPQTFLARFSISCFTFSASWIRVKGLGRRETVCSADSVLDNYSAA